MGEEIVVLEKKYIVDCEHLSLVFIRKCLHENEKQAVYLIYYVLYISSPINLIWIVCDKVKMLYHSL